MSAIKSDKTDPNKYGNLGDIPATEVLIELECPKKRQTLTCGRNRKDDLLLALLPLKATHQECI
jgi:hypothetical protein